jgi:alkylation response protein AidB-like acyl-CoA dehydrogenase
MTATGGEIQAAAPAATLKSRIDRLAEAGRFELPLPGGGETPRRHRLLAEWGELDLSVARLAEAHTDALAILAEAGHRARPGAFYGVWASDAPPHRVTCEQMGNGHWRIEGVKPFCSGATLVDAALVTAQHRDGVRLFDIAVDGCTVLPQPSTWQTSALADTVTTAVRFAVVVPPRAEVGGPGWYLDRPGFWHGSIGPAACWAGGALSLIAAATRLNRRDAHSRAHLGALQASAWALDAMLMEAGRQIDADPHDLTGTARTRGLKVRHLIERTCTDVLDRFGRATGPQLLAYNPEAIRQHAALALYIRQCHGERDLEGIPG